MTMLSLALLLGAKSDDSTVYTTPEDHFRALSMWSFDALSDYNIIHQRYSTDIYVSLV